LRQKVRLTVDAKNRKIQSPKLQNYQLQNVPIQKREPLEKEASRIVDSYITINHFDVTNNRLKIQIDQNSKKRVSHSIFDR